MLLLFGNSEIILLKYINMSHIIMLSRLFLLTLAPSHPVCKLSKIISRVKFQGDDGVDRTQSGGKGHKKKVNT